MKPMKNLTRFSYENAGFKGWKLTFSHCGSSITRYFADQKFGSSRKALAAAEETLDDLRSLAEESVELSATH